MNSDARSERLVVFPGSFDPFTNGHFDLLSRALELFDRVTIAVLENPKKQVLFSAAERVDLINRVVKARCDASGSNSLVDRVSVLSFSGLLVEFARRLGTRCVLRGLRAVTDYEYEAQMALMNRTLSGDMETVFLMSKVEHAYISSSLVREVALLGGDISKFVSPAVSEALHAKLKSRGS